MAHVWAKFSCYQNCINCIASRDIYPNSKFDKHCCWGRSNGWFTGTVCHDCNFLGCSSDQMSRHLTLCWRNEHEITISKWNQHRILHVIPAYISIATVFSAVQRKTDLSSLNSASTTRVTIDCPRHISKMIWFITPSQLNKILHKVLVRDNVFELSYCIFAMAAPVNSKQQVDHVFHSVNISHFNVIHVLDKIIVFITT